MPLPLVKSDACGAGAVRSLTTEETVVSTRSSEVPVAAASRPPPAASSWVAGSAWGAAAAAATSTPTASPQGASLRTRPGRAFVRSSLVFMSSQCPRPDPGRAPPPEGDGSKGGPAPPLVRRGAGRGATRPVQRRSTGPAAHGLAVLSGHVTDRHHSVTNLVGVTFVTATTVHSGAERVGFEPTDELAPVN